MELKRKNGDWKIRRRFMFIIIAFCMWTIGYVLRNDLTSRVAETAVEMAFLTIFMTMGSYVFGAVWQDTTSIKHQPKDSSCPPSSVS